MASDGSQADHKPPAPPEQPPLPEQGLHCPRCDSSNTKFCYYNNYSLTQPRHFCKTCRRYWTRGGTLRNVPIGGGCRKNKKAKTDSSLSGSGGADKDPSSGGMRFLHGFSSSMDHHQLGGLPFSRLHLSTTGSFNQFFPFGDLSSPAVGAASPNTPATCSSAFDSSAISSSLEGLKHPFSKVTRQEESGVHVGGSQDMGPANIHTNIATSIETLSFINQDLHWKLQQQRLAMLFGGNHREISAVAEGSAPGCESQKNHGPYISLQTMGSSTAGDCGENPDKGCLVHNSNELFYGNSFALANSSNSGNKSSSWNGVESWNDLHQNSALR